MERLGSYPCLNKQGKIRKLIELKQGFYKKKEDYSFKGGKAEPRRRINRQGNMVEGNESVMEEKEREEENYIYIYIGKEDEKKGIENVQGTLYPRKFDALKG